MLKVRSLRSFVCLLLAVTTAAGTVASQVHACACGGPRTPDTRPPLLAPHAPAAATDTAPVTRSCCCPPGTVKTSCCCQTKLAAPARPAAESDRCQCARCEGGHPVRIPDGQPPGGNPATDQAAQAAATVSPLAPVTASVPPGRFTPTISHPSADLVTALVRLTC